MAGTILGSKEIKTISTAILLLGTRLYQNFSKNNLNAQHVYSYIHLRVIVWCILIGWYFIKHHFEYTFVIKHSIHLSIKCQLIRVLLQYSNKTHHETLASTSHLCGARWQENQTIYRVDYRQATHKSAVSAGFLVSQPSAKDLCS